MTASVLGKYQQWRSCGKNILPAEIGSPSAKSVHEVAKMVAQFLVYENSRQPVSHGKLSRLADEDHPLALVRKGKW